MFVVVVFSLVGWFWFLCAFFLFVLLDWLLVVRLVVGLLFFLLHLLCFVLIDLFIYGKGTAFISGGHSQKIFPKF